MSAEKIPEEKNPELKMKPKKYDKYVSTDTYKLFYQKDAFLATPSTMPDMECIVATQTIVAPLVMAPKPHKHDFPQILGFVSSDPMNIHNFGAIIELHLGEGEDEEQYMITTNTWINIPTGLYHCPIKVHKVDVPFVFLEVMLNGKIKYEKKFLDNTSSPK